MINDGMFPLTLEENNVLDEAWEFLFEFRKIDISLHRYRKTIIEKISSKYTIDEFITYEGIVDKLYWNLQHKLANIWLKKDCNKIPYALTFVTETNYTSENELNDIITQYINTSTYYRSFINKLVVVDYEDKKIYTKMQESSIGFCCKNYFNLLGTEIMSSRSLYEKIITNPLLIKTIKIPLPVYYFEMDYPFPNFSFCQYNINDINNENSKMIRKSRIYKMYYDKNAEKNWFKLFS